MPEGLLASSLQCQGYVGRYRRNPRIAGLVGDNLVWQPILANGVVSMFDAYHKWLGIPPAEQPPNHYRLLAIAYFEDDPAVIENAADLRIRHLRSFQTSQENALAERLLNEVTTAKLCLLRPDRKVRYDARLRASQPVPVAPEIWNPYSEAFPPAEISQRPASSESSPLASLAPPLPPNAYEQLFVPAERGQPVAPVAYEPAISELNSTTTRPRQNRTVPRQFPLFLIVGPLVGIAVVAAAIITMNTGEDDSHTAIHASREAHMPAKPPQTTPVRPPRPNQHFATPEQSWRAKVPPVAHSPNRVSQFLDSLLGPIHQDVSEVVATVSTVPDVLSEISKSDFSQSFPRAKAIPPISLTFKQKVNRVDGRDIPNDEQTMTVPIGSIPAGVELKIAAWTFTSDPGTKIILQDQPEQIMVFFSVSKGKPGYATIHVKPWLGPLKAPPGLPCTLPRLRALRDGLPGIIDNAQAGVRGTQQQIQALQSELQDLANSSSANGGDELAKQQAVQTINTHLTTQYNKLRALSGSVITMQARQTELLGIIKQVESYIGTVVQFRIYYTLDHHDVVAAHNGD